MSKTIVYYAAFAVLGMGAASMGPTLSGFALHTRTHLSEISFLFTARSLGYLLGSLVGGRLYDRLPGHRLIAVALVMMAAMMALAPLTSLLWLLAAILLILGMGEGTLDVGGNTLLVWLYRDKVGPFMNGLHFFFGVGAFLSPIIIAQTVLMSGDIIWAYWMLALLALPAAVWVLRMSSPTATAQSASQDGVVEPLDLLSTASASRAARLAHERLLAILIALFFFLIVGAEVSFGGWIFSYAVALNLASQTSAAYLTSAFWGSFTVGRLLGIPIATRFRPRTILLGDLVGCLAGLGIILLWPTSLLAIWLGTFMFGFSMASIFPTTISLAERRMPITGRITGWFLMGGSVGSMSLPWLIGQLFESVGPQVTMFALMVDMIVAMGVFAVLILYSTRLSTSEG